MYPTNCEEIFMVMTTYYAGVGEGQPGRVSLTSELRHFSTKEMAGLASHSRFRVLGVLMGHCANCDKAIRVMGIWG